MKQTHALIEDKTTTRCLPGTAHFLAISAAYLAATPAAVSSNASDDCVPGSNRCLPVAYTEFTGARL